MSDQTYKDDKEKLRFDLVDPCFEADLAAVMTMGAKKYAANTWKQIPDLHSRAYAALRRHLNAWYIGEHYDEESGLQHLAHVAINAMFLHYKTRQMYENTDVQRPGDEADRHLSQGPGDSPSSVRDDHETESELEADFRRLNEVLDRLGSYERPGAFDMYYTSDGSVKIVSGPDHSPQDHVTYISKSTLSRLQRLSDCYLAGSYPRGKKSD